MITTFLIIYAAQIILGFAQFMFYKWCNGVTEQDIRIHLFILIPLFGAIWVLFLFGLTIFSDLPEKLNNVINKK